MENNSIFLPCLTTFGYVVIWLAYPAVTLYIAHRNGARITLRETPWHKTAIVLGAYLLLPFLTAPLWAPIVWFLSAMFVGPSCF